MNDNVILPLGIEAVNETLKMIGFHGYFGIYPAGEPIYTVLENCFFFNLSKHVAPHGYYC